MKRKYFSLSLVLREALLEVAGGSCQESTFASLFVTVDEATKLETEQEHELFIEIGRCLVDEFARSKHFFKANLSHKPPAAVRARTSEKLKARLQTLAHTSQTRSGLGLFQILGRQARTHRLRVQLPPCFLQVPGDQEVTHLSTRQGVLVTATVPWGQLTSAIEKTLQANPAKYAAVYKEFSNQTNQTTFFGQTDFQNAYWALHKTSFEEGSSGVLQKFLPQKSPSKFRVHFTPSGLKVYKVSLVDRSSAEFTPPSSLLKAKLSWPLNWKDRNHVKLVLKGFVKVSDFYMAVADCLVDSKKTQTGSLLKQFFKEKKAAYQHKVASLLKFRNGKIPSTVRISRGDDLEIVEVHSATQLQMFKKQLYDIQTAVALCYKSKKSLRECVLDFIPAEDVLHLVKCHHFTLTQSQRTSPPAELRKVSLFSSYQRKGEQSCCGHYCSVFGEDAYTISAVESAMPKYPQHAALFYDLIALLHSFSQDSMASLLDTRFRRVPKHARAQYKVMRRTIVEDCRDPESLAARLARLPVELQTTLNVKLACSLPEVRRKFLWELELVPVCFRCYMVYQQRDSVPIRLEDTVNQKCSRPHRLQTFPSLSKSLARLSPLKEVEEPHVSDTFYGQGTPLNLCLSKVSLKKAG